MAWSPDGQFLAAGNLGSEGCVEMLTRSGETIWRRTDNLGTVWDVAWSPDGRYLASYGRQAALVWDARPGLVTARIGHSQGNGRVAWSADSSRVALSDGNSIKVVQPRSGQTVLDWDVGDSVWCHAWDPYGNLIATGVSSGAVLVWDLRSGESFEIGSHARVVKDLSWSPDGALLSSASHDNTVGIWDVGRRRAKMSCVGHSHHVHSVSWSPDGAYLVTASWDETIRIWNVETGREVIRFEHGGGAWDAAFSPDGEVLATIGIGSLRLWNVADLIKHPVGSVAVQNDYISRQLRTVGRVAVTRAAPRWVPHLPGAEGRCLGVIDNPALELVFLPDGKRIVTSKVDPCVKTNLVRQ